MRLRDMWQYSLGFALAASVVACGGGEQSASEKPSAPAAASRQKVERRCPATRASYKAAPANDYQMNGGSASKRTKVRSSGAYLAGSGGALTTSSCREDGLAITYSPTELTLDQKGAATIRTCSSGSTSRWRNLRDRRCITSTRC